MNDRPKALLQANLDDLLRAKKHLDYSYRQIISYDAEFEEYNEEQLETVEAFTSRFARCADLLVNKVLRSLDRYELKPGGTLLDVINRAEKRGIISNVGELREMKDIRNIIAHDYAGVQMEQVFEYCKQKKPHFDEICHNLKNYVDRLQII